MLKRTCDPQLLRWAVRHMIPIKPSLQYTDDSNTQAIVRNKSSEHAGVRGRWTVGMATQESTGTIGSKKPTSGIADATSELKREGDGEGQKALEAPICETRRMEVKKSVRGQLP
jgi:hypothetical protein